MSIYHKFEDGDILWTTITSNPLVDLASGSAGWHGNVGVSSSLSLYGDVRSRFDVVRDSTSGLSIYPLDPIDTHSIDRIIYVSGSYPSTGSIRIVKARTTDIGHQQYGNIYITSEDWYYEHLNPILRLYDYYSRYSDVYKTSSYDNYCIFLSSTSPTSNQNHFFDNGLYRNVTHGGLTLSARIKPINVTGPDQTLMLVGDWGDSSGSYQMFISGNTGRLGFRSAGMPRITSSQAIEAGVWSTVGIAVGSGSASFYINGQLDSTVAYSASFSTQFPLTIGGAPVYGFVSLDFVYYPYGGYIREARSWKRKLTTAEMSSSYNCVYYASGTDRDMLSYMRFNDGPLSKPYSALAVGSGSRDYSSGSLTNPTQQFYNFTAGTRHPIWQPADDPDFYLQRTVATGSTSMFKVVHVPSMFYGRQIATGSVKLVCNAYRRCGIERVLIDDGRGGLYVSGSYLAQSSGKTHSGVKWNKVGNVFYSEGFIVITDPSLLDFGETGLSSASNYPDTLGVSFRGTYKTLTKIFHCRVGSSEANASNNKTFSYKEVSKSSQNYDKKVIRRVNGETWISAVGLYNEDRRLVAVAKFAQPIRKREADKLMFRLKIDL